MSLSERFVIGPAGANLPEWRSTCNPNGCMICMRRRVSFLFDPRLLREHYRLPSADRLVGCNHGFNRTTAIEASNSRLFALANARDEIGFLVHIGLLEAVSPRHKMLL